MPDGSGSTARARKKRAIQRKPRTKSAAPKQGRLAGARVPIGEFKANLAAYLDRVAKTAVPMTITKRGRAVAVLGAAPPDGAKPAKSPFGAMKGTVTFIGDIMSPVDVEWNALKPDAKLDPD